MLFLILLSCSSVADQRDYKRYQADLEHCKKQIETRLLESPEFNGDIWAAKSRADIACRNRLGELPAMFSSYEKAFAKRVNLISPRSWDSESLVEGASALAEKHQSGFIGFGNSHGLLEQVNAISEWLLSRNMACHSKKN